jgi:hypothetical protein
MNERHDIDFTIEKDNRKPNSRKRTTAVSTEWKRHKTNLLRNTGHTYGNFRRGTDIPERKGAPFGATDRMKCFSDLSDRDRRDIFKRHLSLSDIRAQIILSLKCVNVTLSKTRKCLKLLQNVLLVNKAYYVSLPISKTK